MVEEVALQPFVKLAYNGALGKQHNVRNVTALGAPDNSVEIAEAVTSMFTGNGAGVDGFSPNYGKDP